MRDRKYIIANNLKLYRKKKCMTQIELAEYSGLSLDSIKRVEGAKGSMSLENFLRISDVLQVPLAFLLYDQEKQMVDEDQIRVILEGKSAQQKEYLLHILKEMADGMEKFL